MKTLNLTAISRNSFNDYLVSNGIPLSGKIKIPEQFLRELLISASEMSKVFASFITNTIITSEFDGVETNFVNLEEAYSLYLHFVAGYLKNNKHQIN